MKERENMEMKVILDSQEKGVKTGANMKANTLMKACLLK
jgi:hypothetical protein